MDLIFNTIFEWIRCTGRHVQSRLVLLLVAIGAFEREDAFPVSAAPQTEGGMRLTLLTPQRRITRRMTIDAARMIEDFVRFKKRHPRSIVIAR
jgi:hypothetical protein